MGPWVKGERTTFHYRGHVLEGESGLVPKSISPDRFPADLDVHGTVWYNCTGTPRFHLEDCTPLEGEILSRWHQDRRWVTHHLAHLHRSGIGNQPFTRTVPCENLIHSLERHLKQLRTEREALWSSVGLGMPTGGIIFRVDTLKHRGLVEQWEVPYRIADTQRDSVLVNVEWEMSTQGRLTPVGVCQCGVRAFMDLGQVDELDALPRPVEINVGDSPVILRFL
jgi:hypothetical protein